MGCVRKVKNRHKRHTIIRKAFYAVLQYDMSNQKVDKKGQDIEPVRGPFSFYSHVALILKVIIGFSPFTGCENGLNDNVQDNRRDNQTYNEGG